MPPVSLATLWKAIFLPSGDQVGARCVAGSLVRRNRFSFPIVLTYRSNAANCCSPVHSNTTREPSGEIAGKSAHPGRAVRGAAARGCTGLSRPHFRYANVATAIQKESRQKATQPVFAKEKKQRRWVEL